MAVTDPPPTWPVEPTVWFIVFYYPTNEMNQAPTITSLPMRDYNTALTQAKSYITDAGNVGVCAISQVTGVVVYPAVPWEDF